MSELTYISVARFADKFNVSTTLVYNLIKQGEIEAIKIGDRNYRISSRTVEGVENSGLFYEEADDE
jgi:excisionase family DNA binding protein